MKRAKNAIFAIISLIVLNIFVKSVKTTTYVSNATRRNESVTVINLKKWNQSAAKSRKETIKIKMIV